MSIAVPLTIAIQHSSSISSNFAIITSLILISFVLYLSVVTIYYGGSVKEYEEKEK